MSFNGRRQAAVKTAHGLHCVSVYRIRSHHFHRYGVGGKAGKLKVSVSFKASPPKKKKKSAPPPPEVVVVIGDEGFTVASPGQEPFSVPKAGDDYNARGLAARLMESKDKLPAGVRARIKAAGSTPHKTVVAVASALSAEVDGSKLDVVSATVTMARDMLVIRLCYALGIWSANGTTSRAGKAD